MGSKAVFLDIDGTIYSHDIGVPDSTKIAIEKLLENGHIPLICTGRTRISIPQQILELGFEGLIAGCGTYVEYKNEVLKNKKVEEQELANLKLLCGKHKIFVIIEGEDCLYYNPKVTNKRYMKMLEDWKVATGAQICDLEHGIRNINKITVSAEIMDEAFAFVKEVDHIFYPIHQKIYSTVELVPIGCNKATGIQQMIKHLGIKREDTYAFGDSNNDMEMLEYVNYGIAMGNSSKEVLEKTKYKTTSIHEDGIYRGLKEFGLI
ncbi:Cof-type HAD-IIB family hydrolase [Anaerosacchariphilus polymeriproducens]|uniref:Cof-type HAD-IIB family hydrolase n=1 Tax=Anaerosacchariphilus polymeriproducens TaxID=1812858 RepID=A0A371ASL7_9FIRM|nr:Cof-type HAD-IIB family hydrolase [Anaerosacchariphilus polymeriproducens]RDU22566.1 Cof-type HAD-IIB family hydrolase [Anaerosacchariphilus polymeriproducens]